MTAVSFNFSGSGVGADGESFSEPERFGHMTVSNDLADLDTVCTALSAGRLTQDMPPPTRIGLLGHSRGGGTAILHAAANPELGAMVTWAAITSALRWDEATVRRWREDGKMDVINMRTGEILPLYTDYLDDLESNRDRLDIVKAAGQVQTPWLIVHGEADESVSPDDARTLHEAARGRAVELRVIAGGGHTFGARQPWAGSTPELEAVMNCTVEWFVTYLI
jgi:fermentation-respiration switch protein FrsA (DUF1100 family)